jgi:parallel beta-helix repeat protein
MTSKTPKDVSRDNDGCHGLAGCHGLSRTPAVSRWTAASQATFRRLLACALIAAAGTALAPSASIHRAYAQAPATPPAEVKEIHSNGVGGGPWSDPLTWKGGVVPTGKDDVTVTAGDQVIFDKDDSAANTCNNIYIDPRSVLSFKNEIGTKVMSVGGAIESYGAIRMGAGASRSDPDAKGDPREIHKLILTGATADKRIIKLMQNGSILVYGARNAPADKRNVVIGVAPSAAGLPVIPAQISGAKSNMIDLQRAQIDSVTVSGASIDNTGSKANERFNITSCRFTGLGRVVITSCDTAVISNNDFFPGEGISTGLPAITVSYSPLVDIKGNNIKGLYTHGIQGSAQPDSTVMNNNITGSAAIGIYWYGSNSIIKKNTITDCPTGMHLTSMTGVVEESTIKGAKEGMNITNANVQVTNVSFVDLVKEGGKAVSISSATGRFLNCNLKPEQMSVWGGNPEIPVQTREYLVVRVFWAGQKEGKPAPGSNGKELWVEVATNNPKEPLKPGQMDLNVIGSPCRVNPETGLTAIPDSADTLVVNAWGMSKAAKTIDPLEYKIRVGVAPEDPKSTDTMKVLKELVVKPQADWFRPTPDNGKPTVEVELK